jgi:hypothetical protein
MIREACTNEVLRGMTPLVRAGPPARRIDGEPHMVGRHVPLKRELAAQGHRCASARVSVQQEKIRCSLA